MKTIKCIIEDRGYLTKGKTYIVNKKLISGGKVFYEIGDDAGDFEFYSERLFEDATEDNQKTKDMTPKYYGAKCKCGRKLDPYTICDAIGVKSSAWDHAVKKLIRAGDGHKSLEQDINEVIDTLSRWKEQLEDK